MSKAGKTALACGHALRTAWAARAAVWACSMVCSSLALPAYAVELPAGKGRETLGKRCTQCHEIDAVTQLRHTRAEWKTLVDSMKDMGAEATPAEFAEIVEYLAANFGAHESTAKKEPVRRAPRPVPWEKNAARIGQALYRDNCVVCHDVDRQESRKLGPSFYHLFQRDKMPRSDRKPERAYIAARVKLGGPIMPAFANKLSDAEIDTLIDYLSSK